MGAVSKAAVVVMVAQLLMAVMSVPVVWAKMDSSGAHGHGQEAATSKLGASRRLLQDVDCIAQDNTNVFCSKPCCDPVDAFLRQTSSTERAMRHGSRDSEFAQCTRHCRVAKTSTAGYKGLATNAFPGGTPSGMA
ncbi:unnamed protein product [Urochloa humidicola]